MKKWEVTTNNLVSQSSCVNNWVIRGLFPKNRFSITKEVWLIKAKKYMGKSRHNRLLKYENISELSWLVINDLVIKKPEIMKKLLTATSPPTKANPHE
jgi:hypothetical protein